MTQSSRPGQHEKENANCGLFKILLELVHVLKGLLLEIGDPSRSHPETCTEEEDVESRD